jgi:TctA family transporter
MSGGDFNIFINRPVAVVFFIIGLMGFLSRTVPWRQLRERYTAWLGTLL